MGDASSNGHSVGENAWTHGAPTSGLLDPQLAMLPYLELSRALARAHRNTMAMIEANRFLLDSVREIMRRQQDLALDLAERAWADQSREASAETAEAAGDQRDIVFGKAADAVREIGQALIDVQLSALQRLQAGAGPARFEAR